MQLTATRPAESLDALAARVYDLGDKPTQAATRAAAKALAEANPFLRQIDDVPAGTVVEVPPFDKGEVRPGATTGEDEAVVELLFDRVRAAASLIQRQLLADLDREAQDARDTIKLARSGELKKLRGPGLSEALTRTVAAAEARSASVDALRSRSDAVIAQIAADLADLAGSPDGKAAS